MSKCILSFIPPRLVNNSLTTIPGENALDAAMGKTLQDSIDTKDTLKIKNIFEMNIAVGYNQPSHEAIFNYNGCISPINIIHFCTGMGEYELSSIRAKDFIVKSPYNKVGDIAVKLSDISPTLAFTGPNNWDPEGVIKDQWNTVTNNLKEGIYMITISCGSLYFGIALLVNDSNGAIPNYGSVLVMGYGKSRPTYMRLNSNTWSPTVEL